MKGGMVPPFMRIFFTDLIIFQNPNSVLITECGFPRYPFRPWRTVLILEVTSRIDQFPCSKSTLEIRYHTRQGLARTIACPDLQLNAF
jgi:hypothetical protein